MRRFDRSDIDNTNEAGPNPGMMFCVLEQKLEKVIDLERVAAEVNLPVSVFRTKTLHHGVVRLRVLNFGLRVASSQQTGAVLSVNKVLSSETGLLPFSEFEYIFSLQNGELDNWYGVGYEHLYRIDSQNIAFDPILVSPEEELELAVRLMDAALDYLPQDGPKAY